MYEQVTAICRGSYVLNNKHMEDKMFLLRFWSEFQKLI